jgi:hypothetical protein
MRGGAVDLSFGWGRLGWIPLKFSNVQPDSKMRRSGSVLVSVCFGLVVLLLVALPVAAFVLFYSEPFESWRRAKAEALLNEAMDLKTTVSGPADIGLGFEPTVSISGIASVRSDLPSDVKGMTTETLSFKLSVLKLLRGSRSTIWASPAFWGASSAPSIRFSCALSAS